MSFFALVLVDKCATEGVGLCDAYATCVSTESGYQCECNEGLTGDGVVCNGKI